jgi:hypothetical protein
MRKALVPAALVAAACVITVFAQQRDATSRDATSRDSNRDAPPDRRRSELPPQGMELGSRLELYLMRPGRVIARDTWRVGRVECRPWDNGAPGSPGSVRVNAVVASPHDHPEDKTAGVELIVQDEIADRTFLFDAEQVADLLVGLETVRAAAETMRDPPQDVGRRAVYNLNGLEIGMAPRRSGGYLAPVGPDEQPVGLNPDNFQELKNLLAEAQTILKRETAAK